MDSADEGRGRWALLVGIDRYPNFGQSWQLDGCVNDVGIMRDALIRQFSFSKDRMTVLLNEQATRDGILAAMEDLVGRVGQDDIVVVHYSGHGSQQTDGPEQDEPDGLDETLVPYDSGRIPKRNRDITDDEIHEWLQRLTARTPFVTLIIDCCHSGTIVRERKNRSIPADRRPHSELAVGAAGASKVLRGGGGAGASAGLPPTDRYVLFAACGSWQVANEIAVGAPEKVAHGVLTYFLVQELMAPGFQGATCLEIFERLSPRLRAECDTQSPQLEGAQHRQLFGVSKVEPMSYIPLLERERDRVVLGAGAVCGVTVGSRWNVYPPGTRSVSGPDAVASLGTVEIVTVASVTSEGKILDEIPRGAEILQGCRAVETVRCLKGARLAVEIVAPAGNSSAAALSRRIAGSRLLWQTRSGESAGGARVFLLGPGIRSQRVDSVPVLKELDLSQEIWATVDDYGELLIPTVPRCQPQALEMLAENLEKVALLRSVVEIRNDGSPLAGLIDFELLRLEAGRGVAPPLNETGQKIFQEGDRVVLEVRNRSPKPLFIYVLDVGLTGKVGLAYPDLGTGKLLEPGPPIQLGRRPGEELTLSIPEGFPLLRRVSEKGPVEGMETLKLFASTSEADFSVLFQPGFRLRSGVAKGLGEVLAAVSGGGGYGAMRSGDEDWTTVERSFLLRVRPSESPG